MVLERLGVGEVAARLSGSKGELGQGVEYRSAQTSSGEGPEMLNPEHVITGWLVR